MPPVRLQSTGATTRAGFVDGGRPSAGPSVLAYLRSQGLADLDVMVVTHAGADHVGGLIDVLAAADIPVLQVLYNGYPGDTATWFTFATAVANEGLTPAPAQFPAEYVWGGMTARVLNPLPGLGSPEQNSASVVLLVEHGSVGYLLTGDVDSTAEAAIVARGTPVAAEILKVAHHGSRYSSGADFLAAVGASEAVIQVGDNTYGHPAPEALSRLSAGGARIWRTDLHGTITVISDGTGYTITGGAYLVFLPWVSKQATPTSTSTSTATATVPAPTAEPTATATDTQPAPPASLSITTLNGTTAPEYVIITNIGGTAQDMTGWRLVSAIGPQTYFFPNGYSLAAGAAVRIESYDGAASNSPTVLFWSNSAIWNNSGDRAELYTNGNVLVDSECYGSGCR